MMPTRLELRAARVLEVMEPGVLHYSTDLAKAAHLRAWQSVDSVLSLLESKGIIEGVWEEAAGKGYRRRMYRIVA